MLCFRTKKIYYSVIITLINIHFKNFGLSKFYEFYFVKRLFFVNINHLNQKDILYDTLREETFNNKFVMHY